MDEITLKNFRCFREEQTARLAPLTLLVGENSTGKTSFMAMIRALWDVAYRRTDPNFKEEPYDLGSFDEIAHHRGGRGGRAETFEAGFSARRRETRTDREIEVATDRPYRFDVKFGRDGTAPVSVVRRFSCDGNWVEEDFTYDEWPPLILLGTPNGSWVGEINPDPDYDASPFGVDPDSLDDRQGSGPPTDEDWERLQRLSRTFDEVREFGRHKQRPYAGAPVRSKPQRTYDPARTTRDPEGDYVPMYLAEVFFQDKEEWNELKEALEKFGQASGLFDEISVKSFGRKASEPFQVRIRKFGSRIKGPQRNLIDVGYGVSQVLPVVTELFRDRFFPVMFDYTIPPMFLLQQPEVHLHPSAQAALGSLFCQVAKPHRQLVIETHSDHLIDRVRMDVRDGTTPLKPEDVSILFFERKDLDVRIHSLRIDKEGNIEGAPDGYRNFFLEETARSLWKRQPIGA
ncbi:MAG: DUF3696 domain-containing protein [Gemmatimonadetes bacterium]|nr:DUF3696 domain-containing protein [Gemmatimonadota bacterium]MYB68884.1 DUF3696 domain-containing protein [Gemmatimonadota bacterium]